VCQQCQQQLSPAVPAVPAAAAIASRTLPTRTLAAWSSRSRRARWVAAGVPGSRRAWSASLATPGARASCRCRPTANCSRTLCGEQGPSVRPTRIQSTGRAAGPSRRGRSKRGKASRWSRCRVTLASQDSPRGRPTVQKTPLFAPFIYKMHHFTKTGSGQI
jgi:hypothetical protein